MMELIFILSITFSMRGWEQYSGNRGNYPRNGGNLSETLFKVNVMQYFAIVVKLR